MALNADQAALDAAFADFNDSDETIFAMLGYAGVGKTFMEAHLLRKYILGQSDTAANSRGFVNPFANGEILIAAPTHKAINVSRRFFRENDIRFERGYDKFYHAYGTPVTGSTAQLLGIRPIISDDQTAKEMVFDVVDRGLVQKIGGVKWIVIDEVSMLSKKHLDDLIALAQQIGAKVLIVGDPGQLPPVKEEAIDFDSLPNKVILSQIMRQVGDSAIPHLAAAIREGRNWRDVNGPGVDHFHNPAGAFIDEIDCAPAEDERERSVFVAYRNSRVNAVQQAACQKIYGHGRLEIGNGEVIVANSPLVDQRSRIATTLCNNGDVLTVVDLGSKGAWGTEVELKCVETGRTFTTEFLNEVEINDKAHPYNVELRERELLAQRLQREHKAGNPSQKASIDPARRAAWSDFFALKNSTVLSASHLFAITSHKSQGSGYRQTFVDATDLEQFDPRALYVASTRASQELIIG